MSTAMSAGRSKSAPLGAASVILLCLAYDLWRPVSNGHILYPALAIMAIGALFWAASHNRGPSIAMVGAALLVAIAVAISTVVGSINGTPGLSQQATQWFGTLIIWGLFANAFTVHFARRTVQVIVVMTVLASAVMLLYIGSQVGLMPSVIPASVVQGQAAGFDDLSEGTAIRWLGLSTLVAAGPLLISGAIVGPDRILPGRKVTIPAAAITVVAAALAGRRAILLVAILAPLFTLGVRFLLVKSRSTHTHKWRGVKIPPAAALLLIAVCALLPFLPGARLWSNIVRDMRSALATYFGVGTNLTALKPDDAVRVEQSHQLLNAWSAHPFFGSGLGADLPDGYFRSAERPWNFEMQYHMFLYEGGILGVVLCLAALVLLAIELRRVAKNSPEFLPSLTATTVAALALLVANASDPYLQAVGHGWGVALAAGVIIAVSRVSNSSGSLLIRDAEPDRRARRKSARAGAGYGGR